MAACPLGAEMTEAIRPEQEKIGEQRPDFFPLSLPPIFHQGLSLAEQCEAH